MSSSYLVEYDLVSIELQFLLPSYARREEQLKIYWAYAKARYESLQEMFLAFAPPLTLTFPAFSRILLDDPQTSFDDDDDYALESD